MRDRSDMPSYTTYSSSPYTLSRVHPGNPVSFVSCFSSQVMFRQHSFSIPWRMTCHYRRSRRLVVARCPCRMCCRSTSVEERWDVESMLRRVDSARTSNVLAMQPILLLSYMCVKRCASQLRGRLRQLRGRRAQLAPYARCGGRRRSAGCRHVQRPPHESPVTCPQRRCRAILEPWPCA